MKGHPVNYQDPAYDAYDQAVTAKLGLPEGLLSSIRLNGEKTNSDRVSSAGARTSYQIIPATRKLILDKYGIDPWLSPENAAEGAGLLLKERLDATGGDVNEAVASYHAGPSGKGRGPVNRAYVQRVTGQATGGSTFDRAKAARQEDEGPSIAKIYDAYKSGKMDPQAKAEFEADVNSGAIILPRGGKVGKSSAQPLPKGVIDAYNSNRSEMSDAERGQIDKDVAEGLVALPSGAKLARPEQPTALEGLGMGARGVMTGAGGVLDLVTSPVRAAIPAIGSYTDTANQLADSMGLMKPRTPGEKLLNSAIEGTTGGAMTFGAGGLAVGAPGAAGVVGEALTAAPLADLAAGATGNTSGELARQNGAGPVGQLAASLIGGGVGVGAVRAAEGVAARLGPKAATIIEATPKSALIDEAGQLTEDGVEAAVRAKVAPDEFKAAVEEHHAPKVADETPPASGQTVRTYEGVDYPVEIIGETVTDANGVRMTKVRGEGGAEGFVPEAEIRTVPKAAQEAPGAPPVAAVVDEAAPGVVPATAGARAEEAASEGVVLSKGQAEKDFETQDAEQSLRVGSGKEANDARKFFDQQAEDIKAASTRFREGLGSTDATPQERGAQVKEALRDMRDSGKAGVNAMYAEARTLAEDAAGKAGHNSAALLDLDTAPLQTQMKGLLIDQVVPSETRGALRQLAAQYGLIGRSPRVLEDGTTIVEIADQAGKTASSIQLPRPVERLSVTNAENFRKDVNDLYRQDTSGRSQSLKGVIDDAVEAAIERAASEGVGDVGGAFKSAREAFKTQKETFGAKDAVERLISFKKGTKTDAVFDENAVKELFKSSADLQKAKAILLANPTEQSKAAWKAMQAHGVGEIFDKALVLNANQGAGAISGAKLNTAISKFGADKLKILLDKPDFDQLMKLRRIIGDATIPLTGTTNPSGSANKIVRFLAGQASKLAPVANFIPGAGPLRAVVDVGSALLKQGKEAAQAKSTLEGITSYKPGPAGEAPKAANDAAPAEFVRDFIRLAKSEEIIAPIIASGVSAGEKP